MLNYFYQAALFVVSPKKTLAQLSFLAMQLMRIKTNDRGEF
jgi:hypothetical protein